MTITRQDVISAFRVSGLDSTSTYLRYVDTSVDDIELLVSNVATDFAIRTFPSSSSGITFKADGDVIMDSGFTIVLLPGDQRTITVTANPSGFDTSEGTPCSDDSDKKCLEFPVLFNLVALVPESDSPPEDDEEDEEDESPLVIPPKTPPDNTPPVGTGTNRPRGIPLTVE